MILTSVSLRNFRIHINSIINFNKGLNYIIGGNGVGKTSVLESIYYLCTTKSNISRSDTEAVKFNHSCFEIKGKFKDITDDTVKVIFPGTDNKKQYYLNDKLVNRTADIIGRYPVVILTPADHAITQGSPSDRRKLIDSIISQASSKYLNNLIDYNKTLKQRTALLNKLRENKYSNNFDEMDSWTERLIATGTELIKFRKKFINEYIKYLKKSYISIMSEHEVPEIVYSYLENHTGENIEDHFQFLIEEKREEELRRGTNLVGPHKDDFIFKINAINLKTFGSQGQNKTFQTALRFAEFFYLKDVTHKTPIFLLDDVFGELDAFRAARISEYLRSVGQVFITLTDFTNFSFLSKAENDLIIKLQKGEITYA